MSGYVVITGTPGTGKSTVADLLGKCLKLGVIHCDRAFIEKNNLYSDEENGSLVVEIEKLERLLRKEKDRVVESHILCDIKLPADFCFVLRTSPEKLEKRLSSRKWDEGKIGENVEVEALDYCLIRAKDNYIKVVQVDTTERAAEETTDLMLKAMKGKFSGDSVDWSDYFLR
jgi:adenylate kinase